MMRITAAALVAALAFANDNGLARVPPLGWNTWCAIGTCGTDLCYESEIRAIADAMVANGMAALGFRILQMDDCWGYTRAVNGSYQWDPTRFPSGLPALVDYLAQYNMTLGVYTDSGIYTCSQGGRDFKIPGSYGHYEDDAATFASWGVRAVKMDWCNTLLPNGTQLDPRQVYPEMSRALNATGAPIYFDSCEWGVDNPWEWAAEWMNAWRIGGDHHDTWKGNTPPSTEGVIEVIAGKSSFAGPGGWNDPDMVYTGGQGCAGQQALGAHCPGMTDTEYVTEFTIWTIAAAPIFVATNVANMTDTMNKILLNKDIIAVHQDPAAIPGDRRGFATDPGCPLGYCQLWSKPLANGDIAGVAYNRDDVPHNITIAYGVLNSTWANAQASLYDLWQHQTLGTFKGSYTALVEPHGVVAVRMKQV